MTHLGGGQSTGRFGGDQQPQQALQLGIAVLDGGEAALLPGVDRDDRLQQLGGGCGRQPWAVRLEQRGLARSASSGAAGADPGGGRRVVGHRQAPQPRPARAQRPGLPVAALDGQQDRFGEGEVVATGHPHARSQ